jgi:hypothetical protein
MCNPSTYSFGAYRVARLGGDGSRCSNTRSKFLMASAASDCLRCDCNCNGVHGALRSARKPYVSRCCRCSVATAGVSSSMSISESEEELQVCQFLIPAVTLFQVAS